MPHSLERRDKLEEDEERIIIPAVLCRQSILCDRLENAHAEGKYTRNLCI